MKKKINIQIDRITSEKLKKLRITPRESYNEIIIRLINGKDSINEVNSIGIESTSLQQNE